LFGEIDDLFSCRKLESLRKVLTVTLGAIFSWVLYWFGLSRMLCLCVMLVL